MRYLFLLLLICATCFRAHATVEKTDLPSGHHYLSLKADALPMAVIQISFTDAGAVSDPEGKAGRAYLGAKMLMEGTETLSRLAFRRELEDRAIDISVSTGQDNVTLTVQTLTLHLNEAMRLLRQMLQQPKFEPKILDKIRSQTLSTLKKQKESPGWLASVHFDAYAYGNHPYALPIEGTETSLPSIVAADLKDWHKRLSRDSIIISAAGDIDSQKFSPQLSALIDVLPPTQEKLEIAEAAPIKGAPENIIIKQSVPQSVALFGLTSVKRSNPDFYAAYVMNHILGGGGLTSRLSSEVRQQRGLAYYASSSLAPSRYSSELVGSFATQNGKALEAAQVVREALSNFAKEGATQEEVNHAIDYITGSFPLALDNLNSQVSYLTSMQRYKLGKDYLKKRNEYFKAVTLDDVNRVAATLLAPPPLMLLVGEPEGEK